MVTNFEMLDLYATKDMRVRQMNICKDDDDNLRGLQIRLEDPNTSESLTMNPIGNLDLDAGGPCL